jgi:glucose-6-phosphate isomerase
LQLYLDGPNDKIHVITLVENFADDEKINIEIAGKNLNIEIGKVLYSSGVATASVLEQNKIPLVKFTITEINEQIIGQIVAFYIGLILLLAAHLKLNPFDQPRVEDGKRICIDILKKLSPVI